MNGRSHRTTESDTGFALLELLIALVLLAIGILAVAQIFPAGTRGQLKDRMMTTAAFYAQEKIERLAELHWEDVDLALGAHPTGGLESLGAANVYKRRWVVEILPPPLENLKKITVSVSWNAGADSVQATTYVRH